MKILFFGTPALVIPFLAWLKDRHELVGIVARPDEPAGRGHKVTPPPAKEFALKNKVPCFQPSGPWLEKDIDMLKDLKADVGIVIAYGRIMPEEVFFAPRLGCLNLHFSLLPKYRGAAPIQWSLMNGETETGLTAFWLDQGMDSGPICRQEKMTIRPEDDALSLKARMIPLGIDLLGTVLADLSKGIVTKNIQGPCSVFAPALTKELAHLDFKKPARQLVNFIRGAVEWPVAWTELVKGSARKRIKILKASFSERNFNRPPGEIGELSQENGIMVQTGVGSLKIEILKPEGKGAMKAWDFTQGAHLSPGDRFE